VVTEIGFVSLLVAGFGVVAGTLAYLAVRLNDRDRYRGGDRERKPGEH
jgi:hypothetical protein